MTSRPWLGLVVLAAMGCGGQSLDVGEKKSAEAASPTPPAVALAPAVDVRSTLSGGYSTVCAVETGGTLGCWGNPNPLWATPPTGKFRAVAAGEAHVCAVAIDGTIACWGDERGGVLAAPKGAFVDISAGENHTCAQRADGTVTCWGTNFGSADPDFMLDPGAGERAIPPTDPLRSVSGGTNYACGLHLDGSLVCWGEVPWDASAAANLEFSFFDAGDRSGCGVLLDGTLHCIGSEWANGAKPPAGRFKSVFGPDDGSWCGITSGDSILCWGTTSVGRIAPPPGAFSSVALGAATCAVQKDDGAVVCWDDPNRVAPVGVHVD